MPATALNPTAGASTANAYVSLAVANQFHADRPQNGSTAWTSASDDQKTAAILWATKLMDSLWVWRGSVVDYVQALLWPRAGLSKRSGDALPTTSIPVEIQHATAEFARQLLAGDRAADDDIEKKKITSLRAGSVALSFAEGVSPDVVPDAVWALVPREWGYPVKRGSGARDLVRA